MLLFSEAVLQLTATPPPFWVAVTLRNSTGKGPPVGHVANLISSIAKSFPHPLLATLAIDKRILCAAVGSVKIAPNCIHVGAMVCEAGLLVVVCKGTQPVSLPVSAVLYSSWKDMIGNNACGPQVPEVFTFIKNKLEE